jgi:ABC-type sugar transport systems, permease components
MHKTINNTIPKSRKELTSMILILIPSAAFLGIFFIYPIVLAFYYSFTSLSLYNIAYVHFIGFRNYVSIFTSSTFWQSTEVTVVFVLISAIIGQMFFGMVIGYVLSLTRKKYRTIITTVLLIAWATPQITAAIMWYSTASNIPAGTLDVLLTSLGFHSINFMSRHWALITVIIANVWLGLGFSVLIFSAGIENINPSVIKATIVDGASTFTRFFRVIVPLLKNSILMDLILITLFTLGAFTIVFGITGPGPADSTNILTIYQYYTAFSFFDIGLSTAIGVFIIAIGVVLSLIYIKIIDVRDL